jgi:1,4-dihydroxy-2-naphthoate polyprenyltransferase
VEIRLKWVKGLWQLVRVVPVISWSGAGVLTTMLPILLYDKQDATSPFFQILYLLLGGVTIQGILAHALNDLMDDQSGTDHYTNGILSGGSGVLTSQFFSRHTLKIVAITSLLVALISDGLLFRTGSMVLAIVLLIGIWGAVAYSAPPLRLSYTPFIGEWLCAFFSIVSLSLAPALLTFHHLPMWAWQNAIMHGLWSLSWLMFHHISDVDADLKAVPKKNTTVVFFDQRFKFSWRRKLPAIFYLLITACFAMSIFPGRPFAASISLIFIMSALVIVATSVTEVPVRHAKSEIGLIALSILNALWLGCCPFK